ncbi:hypothetical protein [Fibrobacter sp.]|uniref:hypothetical protein n=1 Tax=Fibrobacter sp. TaxID=35828 RepID=UPI0038910704
MNEESVKALLSSSVVFLSQYAALLRTKERDLTESEKVRLDAIESLKKAILKYVE